jgi:predicted O-methyltransferase YrrM
MSEFSTEHYFPELARHWGSDEAQLRRWWEELNGDRRFLAAINDAIRDVADFQGKQFAKASEMRVYRCLLYLAVRALRPQIFVETGVQNGMSSAFILLGMEHNGFGTLCSVDLPPVEARILEQGTNPLPKDKAPGWIIPDYLRPHHELNLGAAEQLLPALFGRRGTIDVFLHDSDHSYSHIAFEMGLAWRYLKPSGWIMVDNIEQNDAYADFARGVGGAAFVVSTFNDPDRVWQHGLLQKPAD